MATLFQGEVSPICLWKMVPQLDTRQQLSAHLCAWDATGLLAAAGREAGGSQVRGFRADGTSGEGVHLARQRKGACFSWRVGWLSRALDRGWGT